MNLKPKYDAILVAGEGKNSYKVYDQHKAFLQIQDKYVITRVVETLQATPSVRDIYLVGPRKPLLHHLEKDGVDLAHPKKIHILEQKENLFENIWHSFLQTLPSPVKESQLEQSPYRNKAVLVVPCDSPLITPHEVEYFLQEADMDHYDHVLGLTPEESLEPFYPKDGLPGIQMAYLHMKEKRYRINNLHLVKPVQIKNRHLIQTMYRYRYQRNLFNVFLFTLKLIGKDKRNRWRYHIGLSLGLMASWLKIPALIRFCRSLVPKKGLEQVISSIMATRFVSLSTPFPGATLDIDNARDFETIKQRFTEWQNYLQKLNETHPLPETSIREVPRERAPSKTTTTRPSPFTGMDRETVQ